MWKLNILFGKRDRLQLCFIWNQVSRYRFPGNRYCCGEDFVEYKQSILNQLTEERLKWLSQRSKSCLVFIGDWIPVSLGWAFFQNRNSPKGWKRGCDQDCNLRGLNGFGGAQAQVCNEDRHGKADSPDTSNSVNLNPGCLGRKRCDSELHCDPRK